MMVFFSWGIGAIIAQLIEIEWSLKFDSKTIIKDDFWNKFVGVNLFQQFVTKTIYGKLNQTIKISNRSRKDLTIPKKEMIKSEIGHFVGFLSSQLAFIVIYQFNYDGKFFLAGTLFNILLNGYPFLLQQKNKIRINRIINNYSC